MTVFIFLCYVHLFTVRDLRSKKLTYWCKNMFLRRFQIAVDQSVNLVARPYCEGQIPMFITFPMGNIFVSHKSQFVSKNCVFPAELLLTSVFLLMVRVHAYQRIN